MRVMALFTSHLSSQERYRPRWEEEEGRASQPSLGIINLSLQHCCLLHHNTSGKRNKGAGRSEGGRPAPELRGVVLHCREERREGERGLRVKPGK